MGLTDHLPPLPSFLLNAVADRDLVCTKLAEMLGRAVTHARDLPRGLRLPSRWICDGGMY